MVPFNFKRCMRLTGDLLIENKKSFLLLWAIPVLALLTIIVLLGVSAGDYGTYHEWRHYPSRYYTDDVMEGFNLFMMLTTGVMMCCIAASRGLSNTSTKEMAISSLMLPVSEKERYVARFILYVPMYTLAFAVGLVLVECMRFGILSAIYPHSDCLFLYNPFTHFDIHAFWTILFSFIGVQSFFFLGGAIWPKIGMVFTFVFFIANFVFNIVLASCVLINTDCYYDYYPELQMQDWSSDDFEHFFVGLSIAFCVISCGINYVLAYFRCKEREIINRW